MPFQCWHGVSLLLNQHESIWIGEWLALKYRASTSGISSWQYIPPAHQPWGKEGKNWIPHEPPRNCSSKTSSWVATIESSSTNGYTTHRHAYNIYIYKHTHTDIYIYIYIYIIYIHTHTHKYIYIYIVYIHVYIYIYVCVFVCVCACIWNHEMGLVVSTAI